MAQLKAMPLPMRMRYGTLLVIATILSVYILYLAPNRSAATQATPNASWLADLQRSLPQPDPALASAKRYQKVLGKSGASEFPNSIPKPKRPPLGDQDDSSWSATVTRTLVHKPPTPSYPPIKDPWPLLNKPGVERPAVPSLNRPPQRHVPEKTPLLVGFTRGWPQLLQCVASYIAAGWPAEDIYVVENTGAMYSNRDGKLTLQNPFYLNHSQLATLGVNVINTPTLLSFSQLQNFYAWTALERQWDQYFWSHQDVLVFSYENTTSSSNVPYGSLYSRAVAVLRHLRQPGVPKWSNHFFAYDHLTLVNRDAILAVGGWDTHIPFYASDCDMYDRLVWAGYWQGETAVGVVLDVGTVLDDLGALFRIPGVYASFEGDPAAEVDWDASVTSVPSASSRSSGHSLSSRSEEPGASLDSLSVAEAVAARRKARVQKHGETWAHLIEVGRRMESDKWQEDGAYRNSWQVKAAGGQGEPFYRDPDGFDTGIQMMIDTGRRVFAEKWGHRGCDILGLGIKPEDAWRLEKDWDPEAEGDALEGDGW